MLNDGINRLTGCNWQFVSCWF